MIFYWHQTTIVKARLLHGTYVMHLISVSKTKRIIFNEVTEPALLKVAKNPKYINMNLVRAQQARQNLY